MAELDETADDTGGQPSDPFAPALAPDPFTQPSVARRKAAIKKAITAVSPGGTHQYGQGFSGNDGPPATVTLPSDEADISGDKYRFSEVPVGAEHNVEDYEAQDPNANVGGNLVGPVEGNPKGLSSSLEMLLGGVQNAKDISPNEYDKLTKEASKGNKLAQQILVKGHFKAQDFPSLTQDLNKMEDPFVQALSNMPNVANAAEAQTLAVTQPYDFSNAESQVNNILANQGYAQLAQPSAQTSAYVSKLDQEASGNPLATSALGLPSINQALAGLGPEAKLSEKAAPNSALLAALLSHIQYEDIYGTGLSSSATSQNPAWLQQLIAAVTGSGVGGALPSPTIAATGVGSVPSTGSSTVPNTA